LLSLRDNPAQDCDDVIALLDTHVKQVNVRVEALLQLRQYLLLLRGQCSGARSVQACGILHELSNCNCNYVTSSKTGATTPEQSGS
ncbi:MerR family DNA-binding protein, partial [Aeromonas molluscorum]|uniref:MerR family DNA-binding protein n=1 Tax=Aeromonas molluscorum TaxID=271417 RepID=UPI00126899DD